MWASVPKQKLQGSPAQGGNLGPSFNWRAQLQVRSGEKQPVWRRKRRTDHRLGENALGSILFSFLCGCEIYLWKKKEKRYWKLKLLNSHIKKKKEIPYIWQQRGRRGGRHGDSRLLTAKLWKLASKAPSNTRECWDGHTRILSQRAVAGKRRWIYVAALEFLFSFTFFFFKSPSRYWSGRIYIFLTL